MERFTSRDSDGNWCIRTLDFVDPFTRQDLPVVPQEAVDRLAAYEESGLEPEEVELGPVCAGCDGKTADGKRTSRCPYPNVIEKCFDREKHIISLLKAEAEGRVLVLPCKIGAKVRDVNADYVFTVEKAETCVVYDKPALIFRCGNPGTDDYTAFYDFEIGTDIEILAEECANE